MKAYLIPGAGEDINSRDYKSILEIYKSCGYDPHFIRITWNYRTIDNWVAEVEAQVSKHDLHNSLLSGFSFGAMIAFSVAAKTNPKRLLLFSLSPYFQEDMPLPPRYAAWAGKRRVANFRELSFDKLAQQIHCPTTLFIGSVEKKRSGGQRTTAAHKQLANNELMIVEGAEHNVTDPQYVKAIRRVLGHEKQHG